MNNISYSYQVIMVDKKAKSMVLEYTSPGRPPIRVGTKLPIVGESLAGIAHMYSPAAHWEEMEAEVIVPEVGSVGAWTPQSPEEIELNRVQSENQFREKNNIELTANIQRVLSEMIGSSV